MPNDHADDRLVKAHEDRMEGIEKVADEEVVKLFEDELISEGKMK